MRKNIAVILFLFISGASAYWFWFHQTKKAIYKPGVMYEISKGTTPMGEVALPPFARASKYEKVKKEIKEWLDIGAKAIPIVSLVCAIWVKKRRRKK